MSDPEKRIIRAIRPVARESQIDLRQRRQWFDDPDPEPPAKPSEPPTEKPAPDKKDGEQEKTFTQTEVDRIVGERAKRAADAAVTKLLEGLGLSDVDALKSTVESERKRQDDELSEVDKLKKQYDEVMRRAEVAEQQAKDEQQARLRDKRNAAVLAAAQAAKAVNAEDVLMWADAHASDELAGVMNDAGELDAKKVDAIITAAKEARPNYFATGGPGSPSNQGGKVPAPDPNKVLGDRPLFRL